MPNISRETKKGGRKMEINSCIIYTSTWARSPNYKWYSSDEFLLSIDAVVVLKYRSHVLNLDLVWIRPI